MSSVRLPRNSTPPPAAAPKGEAAKTNVTGEATESLQRLGAHLDEDKGTLSVAVRSESATHMVVDIFDQAMGADAKVRVPLELDPESHVWSAEIPVDQLQQAGVEGPILYGYRAWGPNFEYDPSWTPGSTAGFQADVDDKGNRFNPNKLLFDPYARELSHDPLNPQNQDESVFQSGEASRAKDTGRVAPKSLVLGSSKVSIGERPKTPAKDDILYEVHVRGLTANDPKIPPELRGTFKGAALKARELAEKGFTSVEFLPVHETVNDQNDVDPNSPKGDNYWGYMSLNYFAPDRRYAADKSAGGPTREFKEMVKAYHDAGLKVYLDVVYNHTGEGGLAGNTDTANVLSYRGLDNAAYYQLGDKPSEYFDQTGCGANVNVARKSTQDLIIDSLRYWHEEMGVDGFRFDLAAVLGNGSEKGFSYDRDDPDNLLNRIARELPDIDLVAEPWSCGSYLVGQFPEGWGEWNGKFRDTMRKVLNHGGDEPTPGEMATRLAGSQDLFNGREAWRTVNFITAHDGFTLADLVKFNEKNNQQAWPLGPSDGGEDHNTSWDHGGDRALQRQDMRNAVALMMLAAGRPMINAGDEFGRSLNGNNNGYNLDSEGSWLNPADEKKNKSFADFVTGMMAFRKAHPALRRESFYKGQDANGNGVKDITWYGPSGVEANGNYLDNASHKYLGYRIDGTEVKGETAKSIFVSYNYGDDDKLILLPEPSKGCAWYVVGDTSAWMEGSANLNEPGKESIIRSEAYGTHGRSIAIFVEKPVPQTHVKNT